MLNPFTKVKCKIMNSPCLNQYIIVLAWENIFSSLISTLLYKGEVLIIGIKKGVEKVILSFIHGPLLTMLGAYRRSPFDSY